jgi:hypothetical protein
VNDVPPPNKFSMLCYQSHPRTVEVSFLYTTCSSFDLAFKQSGRYRAWLFRRSGLRVGGSDIEASKCVLP